MPTFVIALTNLIENETKIYFEAAESAVKAVEKTGLIESEFFPSLDAAEEAAWEGDQILKVEEVPRIRIDVLPCDFQDHRGD